MRLALMLLVACSSPPSSVPPGGDQPDAPVAPQPTTIDAPAAAIDAPVVTAACAGKTAQPLDGDWTVAGRVVHVHVPASYDPAAPTPIVLDLHGWSSNGLDQARIAHMIAKSDSAGFIALHPEGHDSPQGWNAGVCCGTAATSGVDDVDWLNQVLDQVDDKLCMDKARVFATGLSNGGFMAHRLACELSSRIVAIGAVAGVLGVSCTHASHRVAIMHVHGTSDPLIPYDGGGVNGSMSVADTIAFWTQTNHCTAAPTTVYQNGDATCVLHGGCDQNSDVELCTIDGGGHQWPGGEDIFLGKLSDDLIATDAIWAFFQAHPRQ
jgi:polyhydroxybutyrate depolymerase